MIRTCISCWVAALCLQPFIGPRLRAESPPSLLRGSNVDFLGRRLPPVLPLKPEEGPPLPPAQMQDPSLPAWSTGAPGSSLWNPDRAEVDLVHYQESAEDEANLDPNKPLPPKKDAKKDEYPNAKITGFTQLDGGWYWQSPNNKATVGDAQDGVGFRRARLAVYGKAAEFTNWQIEMDFATAGRPSFFDTFLEQTEMPKFGNVRIGQFVQPFSVDSLSGFRNLPFLERSLPFLAFVPFRRVGVMAYDLSSDEMTNWAVSVFKTGGFNNAPLGDDRYATDIGDIGGYSMSTRVAHLMYYDPLVENSYFWLVGAGYDFSQMTQNDAAGSGAPGNAGGGPSPFFQRESPEPSR